MGGGQCAWEEGGMHGRRAVCMGGGQHTLVGTGAQWGGPRCVVGARAVSEGGQIAQMGAMEHGSCDRRLGTHVSGPGRM